MNFSSMVVKTTSKTSKHYQQQQQQPNRQQQSSCPQHPSDSNANSNLCQFDPPISNPSLVTFVPMDPMQYQPMSLQQTNSGNNHVTSRFPYNVQQRRIPSFHDSSLVSSSTFTSKGNNHPSQPLSTVFSSTAFGSKNNITNNNNNFVSGSQTPSLLQQHHHQQQQQPMVIRNRFNQRQLTKGAIIENINNNNIQCTAMGPSLGTGNNPSIHRAHPSPPPGFGLMHPSLEHLTTMNSNQSESLSTNSSISARSFQLARMLSLHFRSIQQQQQQHQSAQINRFIPTSHHQVSTCLNQQDPNVFYDFNNPNFNHNELNNPNNSNNNNNNVPIMCQPQPTPFMLMANSSQQGQMLRKKPFLQQTQWMDSHDPQTCSQINLIHREPSAEMVNMDLINQSSQLRPVNLNPNAMDFFPTIGITKPITEQEFKIRNPSKLLEQSPSSPPSLSSVGMFSNLSANRMEPYQLERIETAPMEKVRRHVSFAEDYYHQPSLPDFINEVTDQNKMNDKDGHDDLQFSWDVFDLLSSSTTETLDQEFSNEEEIREKKFTDVSADETLTEDDPKPVQKSDSSVDSADEAIQPIFDANFSLERRRRRVSMSFPTQSNKSGSTTCIVHRRRASMSCNIDLFTAMPGGRLRSPNSSSANFMTIDGQSRPSLKRNRYKTELCIYMQEAGRCPYGDGCCFAHSIEEKRAKAPHDQKERTQPCELYSKSVCYRGSSRCWYLHQKPEFDSVRLEHALRQWLCKPFCPKLFNDPDWFDEDYNPILYDQSKYRSIISFLLNDHSDSNGHKESDVRNDGLNFFKQDENRKNQPIFEQVARELSRLEKPTKASCWADSRIYNWQRAGTKASDHSIRRAFESELSDHRQQQQAQQERFLVKIDDDPSTIKKLLDEISETYHMDINQ